MHLSLIILGAVVLALSIVTIVCICAQQGNSQGLGAMAGGSDTDTFFGKNRSKDKKAILTKIIVIITIVLSAAVLALDILHAILG